ncbi:MAG: hypothetical protein K1X72_05050 [Pyrinomonadaceae bacterium]|nr:hypothetical protein [Pyrinomonadaceae bacterium]
MKFHINHSTILFFGIIFSFNLLILQAHPQTQNVEAIMKDSKQVDTALVLKAISQDYSLVDESSEVDFLICVNENREELDFYPKKKLVQEMENSGLIENRDKQGSAKRENYVYFEGNPIKKEWKEITEEGSIVYLYEITQKGLDFLSKVTKESSKTLPSLSIAKSEVNIKPKILKVVIYDQQTIQKSIDNFAETAKKQIEEAFSATKEIDPNIYSSGFLQCGANLWQKIKPKIPQSNNEVELRVESRTYTDTGEIKINDFPDQIISSGAIEQFWKAISENFTQDKPLLMQQTDTTILPKHLNRMGITDNDFPSPDLSNFVAVFIVESNNYKFVVVTKGDPQLSKKRSEPKIFWIDIIGTK